MALIEKRIQPLSETWKQLREKVPELPNVQDPWSLNLEQRRQALLKIWQKVGRLTHVQDQESVMIPAVAERTFGNALRGYNHRLGGPPGEMVPPPAAPRTTRKLISYLR